MKTLYDRGIVCKINLMQVITKEVRRPGSQSGKLRVTQGSFQASFSVNAALYIILYITSYLLTTLTHL